MTEHSTALLMARLDTDRPWTSMDGRYTSAHLCEWCLSRKVKLH